MTSLLSTPLRIASVITANQTLVAGYLTPVNASAGPVTVALPASANIGARLVVEKEDSSSNAVIISGAIRGNASTISLVLQYESVELTYSANGWWPSSGHKTLSSLSATYQPKEKGAGVAAIGDSITANFSDGGLDPTNQVLPDHYLRGLAYNGQSPVVRGLRAQGGYTIQQIAGFIPTILAMSPRPAVCIALAGTNNANETPQLALSRIGTLWDTLVAGGVQPVAATIPPRTDLPAFVAGYNEGIRRLARARSYDLLDFHAVLTDPTTGGWKTGLSMVDGIHPSYAGVKQMALVVQQWASTARLPRIAPPLATSAPDPTDALGGVGLFLVDSNSDGIADHLDNYSATGPTFSIQTDTSGTKWQRITIPSTATGDVLLQWNDGNQFTCAPGDVLEFAGRVQTSGFDAALIPPDGSTPPGGAGPSWTLSLSISPSNGGASPANAVHTDENGILYARVTAPATATGAIKVNLQTGGKPAAGSVWVQFAQVAVRNLTELAASRVVTDVVTTSGSAAITSATAAFTSADVGTTVHLFGVGASYDVLVTTITAVADGQHATLAAVAQQNRSATKLVIAPGTGL